VGGGGGGGGGEFGPHGAARGCMGRMEIHLKDPSASLASVHWRHHHHRPGISISGLGLWARGRSITGYSKWH
jgi:hypothetical protein